MPLVLHLPPGLAAGRQTPARRLQAAVSAWIAQLRLDACALRDEVRLAEMDARLLADVGLTREDVARGALRQLRGR